MRNKISFEIAEVDGGALSVTPCIDGTPLTTLVANSRNPAAVGCWPLVTSVTRVEGGYKWAAFKQPHRPQRNYDAFGPFVFEKGQYEEAVRDAAFRSEPER